MEQRQKRGRPPQYTVAEKAEAIRKIQESGKSAEQMAAELGIGATALRRWMAQADNGQHHERKELAELRRENQQLRMEREILKQALALFVRESG